MPCWHDPQKKYRPPIDPARWTPVGNSSCVSAFAPTFDYYFYPRQSRLLGFKNTRPQVEPARCLLCVRSLTLAIICLIIQLISYFSNMEDNQEYVADNMPSRWPLGDVILFSFCVCDGRIQATCFAGGRCPEFSSAGW